VHSFVPFLLVEAFLYKVEQFPHRLVLCSTAGKPFVTRFLCAQKVLLSNSPILLSATIWLVRYRRGSIVGGERNFFLQKVILDLLLNERMVLWRFDCTNSYGVEMHKEHADKHTNTLLYIYRKDRYLFL